jgi:upstream activation factor subunit UAF30
MPKKVSKSKSKKTTKVAAPAAVSAPVKDAAAAPAAPVAVAATAPSLGDQFTALLAQLTSLRSQLTAVTTQVRALSKRTDRELKQASKQGRKKRKSGNRAPSGFVKPTKISLELAGFLGKPKGTEMARTEVTREINSYIRAHKLQDPKNGRRILADAKLRKLLKLKKDDELTYFNLQRYMSPHFAKATKAVASA